MNITNEVHMKKSRLFRIYTIVSVMALAALLAACGGGGGGGGGGNPPPATDFTLGGTLTGLAANASVTISLNGGAEDKTLSDNGPFSFTTRLAASASYVVTIKAQPGSSSAVLSQFCAIAKGRGTIASKNVDDIAVKCFSVSSATALPAMSAQAPTTITPSPDGNPIYSVSSSTTVPAGTSLTVGEGAVLVVQPGASLTVSDATSSIVVQPSATLILDSSSTEAGAINVSGGSLVLGLDSADSSSTTSTVGDTEDNSSVVMGAGSQITVSSSGSLKAIGTASNPIVFTGKEKTAGYWKGIVFQASNTTANQLDNVIVEYAGGGALNNYTGMPLASLAVYGTASSAQSRLSMKNSVIRNGKGYGFYFNSNAVLDDFSNMRVTGNALGAGRVDGDTARFVTGAPSSYTGNTADYVYVSSTALSVDQSWPALDVPYHIGAPTTTNANLTVGASKLTIAAGATLVFGSGNALVVGTTGSLNAGGSASAHIVMKGQEATAGYWKGLAFNATGSADNKLSFVDVSDAGSSSALNISGVPAANLIVYGATNLAIDNCNLTNGSGYGFYYASDAVLSGNSGMSVTGNASGAGLVVGNAARYLSASPSTYKGNAKDFVYVSTSTALSVDQGWALIDVPYHIGAPTATDSTLAVNAGLSIAAGNTLVFGTRNGMAIGSNGYLNASGTPAARIAMKGDTDSPGAWKGLGFNSSPSASNKLSYVDITYAGYSAVLSVSGVLAANLIVYGGTVLAIDNCRLSNGSSYGFFYSGDATLIGNSSMTVTGNASGAGYVVGNAARFMSSAPSSYAGNASGKDYVYVSTGTALSIDQSWADMDVPYHIGAPTTTGAALTVNAHLTIAPGASLAFGSDNGLSVSSSGSLTATGAATARIAMTREEENAGYWAGIGYNGSASGNNDLAYVDFSYGGYSSVLNVSGGVKAAALILHGGSLVNISNCSFANSSANGYGVSVDVPNATINGVKPNDAAAAQSAIGASSVFSGNSLGDVISY